MEDWRLEKDRSGGTTGGNNDYSSGFINETVDIPFDPWTDQVARYRRYSEWLKQKSMASFASNINQLESKSQVGGDQTSPQAESSIGSFAQSSESIARSTFTINPDNPEIIEKQIALENRECFAEDVIKVWNQISQFIITHLKEGNGVKIPGLCTFTIQEEKQSIPDTIYYIIRRTPLMILSKEIVHMYKLINVDEYNYLSKAHSVPLKLSEIASKLQTPRRIVEGVVTEVLQSFARAVVGGKNVEFPFPNIGKLRVTNRIAKMKFYEQFCKKVGLDIPKPNLNPPEELLAFPNSSLTKIAIAQIHENQDDNENTLPGHMTPLRKHIPTETYRSVFHLREVRSVHDGTLLVPMKMKIHGERKDSKMKNNDNDTKNDKGNSSIEISTNVGPEKNEKKKSLDSKRTSKTSYAGLNDDKGKKSIQNIEEFEIPSSTQEYVNPLYSQSQQKIESKNNEQTFEVFHKSDATKPQKPFYGSYGGKDEDELLKSRRKSRKSTIAEPLWNPTTITGKYDIDMTNANKTLFKRALQAHHYCITSQILGVDVVKQHYARRDRLKFQPLSYDDKRFNPPSPK